MADLIAQGKIHHQRWRRHLPPGETKALGRASGDWLVPWDDRISRTHAHLLWDGSGLVVAQIPQATNPIYFAGEPRERFRIEPDEYFVIGETTFTLSDERAQVSLDMPHPAAEQTFTVAFLRSVAFRNAERQIVALSRLPDLIAGAGTDQELVVQLVNIVLSGIPQAAAVAVTRIWDRDADGGPAVELVQWDRPKTTRQEFQPSQRLILEADRQQQSVVHVWNRSDGSSAYTQMDEFDWSFCTPIQSRSCPGWCIYVAGNSRSDGVGQPPITPRDLCDELKFTEIIAATVGNMFEVRSLERRQASLARFFSAPVLEAIASTDMETVLAPREADVSVLFCDLRGFSRRSERSAGDLLGLLRQVSDWLGIATRLILEQGGVIGDFHGDAAMGFWGWPIEHPDIIPRAAQAAIAIQAGFSAIRQNLDAHDPIRIGMGIASGHAVAGRIGTVDQEKVTVFGPVVNVASRLEALSTTFDAEILIDEPTARTLLTSSAELAPHVRHLARIRPYGMQTPMDIYQLLSAAEVARLSADDRDQYASAVRSLTLGDWSTAEKYLESCEIHSGPTRFLMEYIQRHNGQPPSDWNGVIRFERKA
jgi:adenylate cyclase